MPRFPRGMTMLINVATVRTFNVNGICARSSSAQRLDVRTNPARVAGFSLLPVAIEQSALPSRPRPAPTWPSSGRDFTI